MKKPWAAAVLNIIPGLGYLYLGSRKAFAWMLIVSVAAGVLEQFDPAIVNSNVDYPVTSWGVLSFVLVSIAFIVDGYFEAKRINDKKVIG